MITISTVSHGHGNLVCALVRQLLLFPEIEKIIVTLNIPEAITLPQDDRIQLIQNFSPKGFGANHNQAIFYCDSRFFCVLNPDISFGENPFPQLMQAVSDDGIGVVVPIVINPNGVIEDSIRKFPSPLSILRRAIFGYGDTYIYAKGGANFYSEWAAGMCMLFPSAAYKKVGGFDESYYLYVEDVDICVRLWKASYKVLVCSSAIVSHDARRASRKNWQHLYWHATGLLRYFFKHSVRLPKIDR